MQLTYEDTLIAPPKQPSLLHRLVWPTALVVTILCAVGFATPELEERDSYLGSMEKKITQLLDAHERVSTDAAWDNVKNETAYFYWLEALDREVENIGDAFYLAEIATPKNWDVRKDRLAKSVHRAENLLDKVQQQMFKE
ncbi:MAG: hypothetical protein R3B54_00020 [Bdellovibrionota bacterium]